MSLVSLQTTVSSLKLEVLFLKLQSGEIPTYGVPNSHIWCAKFNSIQDKIIVTNRFSKIDNTNNIYLGAFDLWMFKVVAAGLANIALESLASLGTDDESRSSTSEAHRLAGLCKNKLRSSV